MWGEYNSAGKNLVDRVIGRVSVSPGTVIARDNSGNLLSARTSMENVVSAIKAELNPFKYKASQIRMVRQAALTLFEDDIYIGLEASAVAGKILVSRGILCRLLGPRYAGNEARAAAELRFNTRVASTLGSMIAAKASKGGFEYFAFFEPDIGAKDSIVAVKEQIDRVDLCQLQVYNTLMDSCVRNAYVSRVAEKADEILTGQGKV
jgi:hypothetical protein